MGRNPQTNHPKKRPVKKFETQSDGSVKKVEEKDKLDVVVDLLKEVLLELKGCNCTMTYEDDEGLPTGMIISKKCPTHGWMVND